jgi:hypothetical protein
MQLANMKKKNKNLPELNKISSSEEEADSSPLSRA